MTGGGGTAAESDFAVGSQPSAAINSSAMSERAACRDVLSCDAFRRCDVTGRLTPAVRLRQLTSDL
jgi:hypothetical protein